MTVDTEALSAVEPTIEGGALKPVRGSRTRQRANRKNKGKKKV